MEERRSPYGPEIHLRGSFILQCGVYEGLKSLLKLFESQSVIEYWEKFASHAFENTATSVFSHCVLLKPSGEPIPCTFCFSIRRDIFDLPSVVIGTVINSTADVLMIKFSICITGQWLPLM